MAITGSFVASYDRSYPYTGSTNVQHFGYSSYGHRAVTVFKFVTDVSSKPVNSIDITVKVVRGTAYPTNKTSRWNITLDSQDAGYSSTLGNCSNPLGSGLTSNANSYPNETECFPSSGTATITTTESTFYLNFDSVSSSIFSDSGTTRTFYAYLYSATGNHDMIKCTSISATINYDSNTSTSTSLNLGNSSSPTSTVSNPTYNNRNVYWRISGLGSPQDKYLSFHVFKSSGFSMNQGQSTFPTGTALQNLSSPNSTTLKEVSGNFTVNANTLYIGGSMGVLSVARSDSGDYWRVGGSGSTIGSPAYPQIRYIKALGRDWFEKAISISTRVTGKNSATITVTHNTSNNSPKYLNYVELSTSQMAASGTNTYSGTMSGYCTFSNSSSAQTQTISKTGLSPGTTYTFYPMAYANTTYSAYKYYGLNKKITFTTDANYTSQNVSSTVTGSTTATIQCGVNSKINLDGYIYYSTTSGLSSAPSTKVALGDYYTITKNLTGLTNNKTYNYYFYVKSSVSGVLYQIGSTSFTTDASSYSQTGSVSSVNIFDAIINISSPSPTTNLDGKTYFSTTNSNPTKTLSIIASGNYNGNITISNLSQNTNYKLYPYVKSSASNYYYPTNSNGISFTTLSSSYSADCLATGIGIDCAYLFATHFSSTVNMDGYYITDVLYADGTTPDATIANYKYSFNQSRYVSGLIPGMSYTYYFYVSPTGQGLMRVGSVTFTTRSSVVYYGENLTPHRIYMVRNGRLEGVSLYREGTPEILYLEDGSTITTSDGLIFNTTEGDIDI